MSKVWTWVIWFGAGIVTCFVTLFVIAMLRQPTQGLPAASAAPTPAPVVKPVAPKPPKAADMEKYLLYWPCPDGTENEVRQGQMAKGTIPPIVVRKQADGTVVAVYVPEIQQPLWIGRSEGCNVDLPDTTHWDVVPAEYVYDWAEQFTTIDRRVILDDGGRYGVWYTTD